MMVYNVLAAGLLVLAAFHLGAVVGLETTRSRPGILLGVGAGTIGGLAVLASGFHFGVGATALVTVTIGVVLAVAVWRLPDFSRRGAMVLGTHVFFVVASLAWGGWYVVNVPVSPTTRALMLLAAPLALVAVPISLVRAYENWEVLCRRVWHRPRTALTPATGRWPRVSVHVPVHAEPPDVVISTLDALARLDYPNFEVVVLDNNTTEPELWRPVAAHCSRLGQRFRFFHVEGLAGAKAGALNLALEHTDPAAELIAVVDADYHVEANFLADMVPFFDDPDLGFVQSPHAYRDWEDSRFLRMCNWEYAFFFNTGMVSLNERNAGITVGTMCVIRRRALERAGGWAEWCLTEDSELAIRIHALGYSSVYLSKVYGRGLIPSTFAGYRRQRFRWTYGPVQELRHHYRLLVPGRWGRPSRLQPAQRMHHLTHGLHGALMAVTALTLPLMMAVAASMIAHGEQIPLPFELWAAATSTLVVGFLHRWLVYRSLGATVWDWLGATVASMALVFVIVVASITGLAGRAAAWQRTDKFRAAGRGVGALDAVRAELAVAIGLIGSAGIIIAAVGSSSGITGMLALGLVLQASILLASPVMTLVAERDLERELSAGPATTVAVVQSAAAGR